MKLVFLFVLGLVLINISTALEIKNDDPAMIINNSWNQTDPITFRGNVRPDIALDRDYHYLSKSLEHGLHFRNGMNNNVNNDVNGNHSILMGVQGESTELRYTGKMSGDKSTAFTVFTITDHGKLVIEPQARLDLINDRYFTRQIWVYGDSTGTFEVSEGFVSDHTQSGTVDIGVGSYRFSRARFVSHHTDGLPTAVRPKCLTAETCWNGHLVFEDRPGSHWVIESNPQVYNAAVWINADVTIETRQDLTHTGVLAKWSDYTLAGAFQINQPGKKLVKTGPARLILSGEQAYRPGSEMVIEQGTVEFKTDAAGGYFRPGNETGEVELNLSILPGAVAQISAEKVRINQLQMQSTGNGSPGLRFDTGSQLVVSGDATLSGTLSFQPPYGAGAGEEFQIISWGSPPDGEFDQLKLPEEVEWDVSRLYTGGIIKIISGSVSIQSQNIITGRPGYVNGLWMRGLDLDLLGRSFRD